MACKIRLIALTAGALTTVGMYGVLANGIAQQAQDRPTIAPLARLAQAQQNDPKKNPPAKPPPTPHAPPTVVAPRVVAPTVAPKVVAPTVTPKVVTPTVAPKVVAPTNAPKVVSPTITPRTGGAVTVNPNAATVNPNAAARQHSGTRNRGPGVPPVSAAIRGTNRATIAGRNYSLWRGGNYRVYRGGRWRTFVALSALGVIMYGGYRYYPYAYIDLPPDLCDGETEDGCQLEWMEVQTLEGPPDFECVAYCPQY